MVMVIDGVKQPLFGMSHAFHFYSISWRTYECVPDLYTELLWAAVGESMLYPSRQVWYQFIHPDGRPCRIGRDLKRELRSKCKRWSVPRRIALQRAEGYQSWNKVLKAPIGNREKIKMTASHITSQGSDSVVVKDVYGAKMTGHSSSSYKKSSKYVFRPSFLTVLCRYCKEFLDGSVLLQLRRRVTDYCTLVTIFPLYQLRDIYKCTVIRDRYIQNTIYTYSSLSALIGLLNNVSYQDRYNQNVRSVTCFRNSHIEQLLGEQSGGQFLLFFF